MKEMFDEKLPKYYLVKKAIVENIDNEVYDSKEPIPSERELMETYQVSRITIRKAIDELVTEGYLYKVQGKGTYVKTDEGSNNLFSITSCTEDVLKLGLTPSKKVVVSELVDANVKRAKALEITTSDNVYMIGISLPFTMPYVIQRNRIIGVPSSMSKYSAISSCAPIASIVLLAFVILTP